MNFLQHDFCSRFLKQTVLGRKFVSINHIIQPNAVAVKAYITIAIRLRHDYDTTTKNRHVHFLLASNLKQARAIRRSRIVVESQFQSRHNLQIHFVFVASLFFQIQLRSTETTPTLYAATTDSMSFGLRPIHNAWRPDAIHTRDRRTQYDDIYCSDFYNSSCADARVTSPVWALCRASV